MNSNYNQLSFTDLYSNIDEYFQQELKLLSDETSLFIKFLKLIKELREIYAFTTITNASQFLDSKLTF